MQVLVQTMDVVLMNDDEINSAAMALHLTGAKVAIDEILEKLQSSSYDNDPDSVIAVDFENALYKLCLAWHFRHMADDEIRVLTAREYDRLSRMVPNLGFELELMDGLTSDGSIEEESPSSPKH